MTTPGTGSWLSAHNDELAFRLLLSEGPLTRSQLSSMSGLSKPTAGQMLTRLQSLGLVRPVGVAAGSRGPSTRTYGIRPDSVTGVAVSVLPDQVDAVLVDPTDAEHPVVAVPLPRDQRERSNVADVRAAVRESCRAAGADPVTVSAVTIGVQAAVDEDADAISCAGTLPGWPVHGAAGQIADATGLAVRIENDVNLAARAERSTAHVQGLPSFAYLWLGQGLGMGLDIGGIVRRGAFSSAGEIGYLEAPRSARALDPDAADFTDLMGGAAIVRLLGGEAGDRLADMLPRLAGNAAAVADLARRVALLVSPILTVLDPAAFILGGPTADAAGPELAALVQRQVGAERHPKIDPQQVWSREHVDVRLSAAGPAPILRGARLMLIAQLRDQLRARIGARTAA